ncbi:MAG: LPS-assembly protein LptD [Rhodospirillaceae bacterium]|nr:LPS-assembly protein LptD [Rhodospirillaceae bacterium]
MTRHYYILPAVSLLLTVLAALPANSLAAVDAQMPETVRAVDAGAEEEGVRFTADEMQHDGDLDIITARGNVHLNYEERVLRADTIIYNRRQDLVSASGNITLLEPTGEVIFAEFMELTGDIRHGIIRDLRSILSDRSRIAAAGGRLSEGNRTDMRQVVYSPCELCIEDPSRPPLWQLKAIKVVHDKSRQTIEYTDAWLELAGIPILYTPYLSHPDPTVKRRSGFLAPSIGSSNALGARVATPYFLNIASNADATITPIVTTKQGIVLGTEYRHKFVEGELTARGSIAENESDADYETEEGSFGVRGHIAAKGRFDLDDTWRWGFDLNRASDDTYMSRFGFSSDRTISNSGGSLTSQLFAEGFRERNYVYVGTTTFQGLQETDNDDTIPLILPLVEYNHESKPGRLGGKTNLDVNILSLTRNEGTDTHRVSMRGGWQLPYIAPKGDIYTLSASLNADFYQVNSLSRGEMKDDYSGIAYRLMPQVSLDWRYPFVRQEGSVYQMFEPIAAVVLSPYGGNPDKIPNEDSLNFEFDDTNLFSTNRFSGIDKVEGGPRVNYGFKWGVFGEQGGSTSLLVGQSYRYKVDDTFAAGSGLDDNFSDIVGRVHVSPKKNLDVYYRTRLSKDNLEARRNEINMSAGPPSLNVTTRYIYFDRQEDSEFAGREEINGTLSSQLSRYWHGSLSGTRDMDADELRSMRLGLTYEDECFLLSTNLSRTTFEDRDLQPEDSIMFRIVFKTLGEVAPSTSLSTQ